MSLALGVLLFGSSSCKKLFGPSCEDVACVVAIQCLPASCTGTQISAGCCPCPKGYVHVDQCLDHAAPATPATPSDATTD